MSTVAERVQSDRSVRVLPRIRAEFNEMPGLKLTLGQAARIFGADADETKTLLNAPHGPADVDVS